MAILDAVGRPVRRYDAYEKVTGRAIYVGDRRITGVLYGKILHSPISHGIITKIDTSRARELPGVVCVVTYEDVPNIPFTSCGHPYPFDTPEDQLILNRHVRYVGDTIAAVAAETPEIAQRAIDLIEFEYEELPAVFTVRDALAEGAVEIHEGSHNICGENEFEIGSVDQAFSEAAYIFEDEFDTPIIAHSQMETHVSLVEEEAGSDRLNVYVANQMPNVMRERIAYALGLGMKDVRVIKGAVGGGFGGKQEPVYDIINAFLVTKCHRPVLLSATREENLSMTRTRHSMHIKLRSALDKNYRFIGREILMEANNGGYASHGHNPVLTAMTQAFIYYPTPNVKFTGRSVYTNMLIAGAMRGYGVPQWTFAMDSHMENMANALGIDPVEFRWMNVRKEGDPMCLANVHMNSCALPQLISQGKRDICWDEFKELEKQGKVGPKAPGKIKRGIGVAFGSYAQSCYPHSAEMSVCRCQVHEDGFTTISSGSADVGQGTDTILTQIAAEALGFPHEWVRIPKEVDTDFSPFDPGAYASRQCYVTGHAMKKAALACRKDILDFASSKILHRPVEELDIKNGFLTDKNSGEELCPVKDVTMEMYYRHPHGAHSCVHEEFYEPDDNSMTFIVSWAIVNVDTATGKVEVERLLNHLDSGRILNPSTAFGQLTGGAVMSYGFGLTEQILVDQKTGRVRNDNLLDYKVPTMADYPDVEGLFIESYEPTSAYGNKSMGEPVNLCPAVAIRNAVVNATGVKMNRVPLTPERVWTFLNPEEGEPEPVRCGIDKAVKAAENYRRQPGKINISIEEQMNPKAVVDVKETEGR